MSADRGQTRVLLATVALIAILAPSGARAAGPVVNSIEAYGDAVPSVDPERSRTLFANSTPRGYGETGKLYVRGNATPGVPVHITVTDGSSSITHTVNSHPTGDIGAEIDPGDFHAEMKVTELGIHSAAEGAAPDSEDPADWGSSVLTITAVADGGSAGSEKSTTITKYAATPGDTIAPALQKLNWPPEHWCHLSGTGMGNDETPGLSGDRESACGRVSSSQGALPDVTWVACIRETSEYPPAGVRSDLATIGSNLSGPVQEVDDVNGDESIADPGSPDFYNLSRRDSYCRTDPARSGPTGTATVSGLAQDLTLASGGVASEIKSIIITIKLGSAEVLKWTTEGNPATPMARINGPEAKWDLVLNINMLESNYPGSEKYIITVDVEDAWGNKSSTTSPAITVYPW